MSAHRLDPVQLSDVWVISAKETLRELTKLGVERPGCLRGPLIEAMGLVNDQQIESLRTAAYLEGSNHIRLGQAARLREDSLH
jgi:hypothetical protein